MDRLRVAMSAHFLYAKRSPRRLPRSPLLVVVAVARPRCVSLLLLVLALSLIAVRSVGGGAACVA